MSKINSQTEWECFKVADFFSLCSWEGEQNKNLKTKTDYSDWRSQKVKEFFRQGNWQGLMYLKTSLTTNSENIITLTVQEFFNLIDWDGHYPTAAVAEITYFPAKTSEDGLTLNDLSDLF